MCTVEQILRNPRIHYMHFGNKVYRIFHVSYFNQTLYVEFFEGLIPPCYESAADLTSVIKRITRS